jgi:hypothetical protein
LTGEAGRLTVQIRFRDVEETFSGSPEEVWLAVNRFFGSLLPSFETAQRLTLSVDLGKLAKDCEGLIAFSPEGANLLVARDKLTDVEALALLLLAGYVGFRLGKLESEAVARDELQAKLGKDWKIVSTRLGELVKAGLAVRTGDEKYKMTTFGTAQMQKEITPRIKAKIG